MNKAKDYIQLHLNILLFSLTSVFSKAASVQLNRGGIKNPLLYVFLFLLIFHENLTVKNIIGLLIVLVGVMVVQRYE